MRLMLKFTVPVEKGNQAVQDGTMGRTIDELIEQTKPEASYFMVEQGKRAGLIFFELADPSGLPKINEPLFAKLDAAVEIVPVLNRDDLRRSLSTSV